MKFVIDGVATGARFESELVGAPVPQTHGIPFSIAVVGVHIILRCSPLPIRERRVSKPTERLGIGMSHRPLIIQDWPTLKSDSHGALLGQTKTMS